MLRYFLPMNRPSFDDLGEDEIVRPMTQDPDARQLLIQQLLQNLRERIDDLERLLFTPADPAEMEQLIQRFSGEDGERILPAAQSRAVEGVFDGEYMVGEDGRKYLIPPNYASKSKLVEGDLLRLTITDSGRFIFKQKGPIDRQRLMGTLIFDEEREEWGAAANNTTFRVLPASVTYYKGDVGDEVVLLVPKNAPSAWAAVENIIKHQSDF